MRVRILSFLVPTLLLPVLAWSATPVQPNTLQAELFYSDPVKNRIISRIAIDSKSNIIGFALQEGNGCNFGICGVVLYSIASNGLANWIVPQTGYAGQNVYQVAIGQDDSIYFEDYWALGQIDGYLSKTGEPAPGFPVSIGTSQNTNSGTLIVDSRDGTIYTKGGRHSAFENPFTRVIAFRRDGTTKWTADFPAGQDNTPGMVIGPAGIYTYTDHGLIISAEDGHTVCDYDQTFVPIVGGADAVFSYGDGPENNTVIYKSTVNCQYSSLYVTPAGLNAELYAFGDQMLVGIIYTHGQTDFRLFSVDSLGNFKWKNDTVLPIQISAIKGGKIYLVGQDTTDNYRQKLFVVDQTTGGITGSLATDGLCGTCAVAVADNGDIYIGDDAYGVNIYKIASRFRLTFPLKGIRRDQDDHLTAYTAPLNTAFDHQMTRSDGHYSIYGCDYPPNVTDFLGEVGDNQDHKVRIAGCRYGYGEQDEQYKFKVNGNYTGGKILYYDGHPGIDYRSFWNNQVWAAASGTLSYPTKADLAAEYITVGGDPDDFGVLEITVNDSLRIFYLHLATHPRTLSVYLQAANVGGQDFAATADPNSMPSLPNVGRSGPKGLYTITGKLSGFPTSQPIRARVTLTGKSIASSPSDSCVSAVVMPNVDGTYEIHDLPAGYYHIRPLATGYTFANSDPDVRAPGPVSAGELIGASGNAGGCYDPHLHFEVQRKTAEQVDEYLPESAGRRKLSFVPVDPYGWHSDQQPDDPYFLIPELRNSGLSSETMWP